MKLSNTGDIVIEINNFPQASAGAPIPIILADEHTTVLEYYMQDELEVDGEIVDQVAILEFSSCLAVSSGPPNDEAIFGHPLYVKGLRPYGFYKIDNSSWIEKYKIQNRIHPHHKDEHFDGYTHYVLCFHDSIFECICKGTSHEVSTGTLMSNIDRMKEKLK